MERFEDVSEHNGANFCRKCHDMLFGHCAKCETFIDKRKAVLKDGEWYCYECADDDVVPCYRCGKVMAKAAAEVYLAKRYCHECYDIVRLDFIMQYVEKPRPIFHFRNPVSGELVKTDFLTGKQNQYIFVGVELETSVGRRIEEEYEVENIARDAVNIFSGNPSAYTDVTDMYAKHDGTIGDNGIEFVSHPMTLDVHRAYHYREMFDFLIDEGYTSHDSGKCGLHTHINKTSFGWSKEQQRAGLYNLLLLFTKFPKQICKFSRRTQEQVDDYCELFDMPDDGDLVGSVENMTRHTAVNLHNGTTVEIRIFNGSIRYTTFMATLEFANELVRISRESDKKQIKRMTWNSFTRKIKGKYAELDQYLVERGLN
jgi:hypothetical protein